MGTNMGDAGVKKDSADQMEVTFTVAECGEYHELGIFHEDIRTLEEAVEVYRKLRPEHIHDAPSIGIKLHEERCAWDIQVDILTGSGIDVEMVRLMPGLYENPKVQEILRGLVRMFPEKEVIDF